MSIQKYETFLKIVELGSISKAADKLGYSQSAISHVVAGLESEWNVKLLVREKYGVRLTGEGKILLPAIEKVVADNKGLLHQISELHNLSSGIVQIGAFHSAAMNLLPGLVQSFRAQHPNIELDVKQRHYYEVEKLILEGKVDCGFVRLPTRHAIDTIPLLKDQVFAVFQEGKGPEGDVFSIKDLEHEEFIMINHLEFDVSDFLEKHQIRINKAIKADYNMSLLPMIASGIGMCILPEMMVQDAPYPLTLKKLDPPSYRRIGIGFQEKYLTAATQSFIAHAKSYVREHSHYEAID